MLTIRSNNNLKKFWGSTRPSYASPGHAFIFSYSYTSKIFKFGLLSMKEWLYMARSDLLEYKWAKMESYFETPKSERCTEMPGTRARIAREFRD
jgi:hypothetical protein